MDWRMKMQIHRGTVQVIVPSTYFSLVDASSSLALAHFSCSARFTKKLPTPVLPKRVRGSQPQGGPMPLLRISSLIILSFFVVLLSCWS
jgi:hypothetical protein